MENEKPHPFASLRPEDFRSGVKRSREEFESPEPTAKKRRLSPIPSEDTAETIAMEIDECSYEDTLDTYLDKWGTRLKKVLRPDLSFSESEDYTSDTEELTEIYVDSESSSSYEHSFEYSEDTPISLRDSSILNGKFDRASDYF